MLLKLETRFRNKIFSRVQQINIKMEKQEKMTKVEVMYKVAFVHLPFECKFDECT